MYIITSIESIENENKIQISITNKIEILEDEENEKDYKSQTKLQEREHPRECQNDDEWYALIASCPVVIIRAELFSRNPRN